MRNKENVKDNVDREAHRATSYRNVEEEQEADI